MNTCLMEKNFWFAINYNEIINRNDKNNNSDGNNNDDATFIKMIILCFIFFYAFQNVKGRLHGMSIKMNWNK